jgi:hypothetical protein
MPPDKGLKIIFFHIGKFREKKIENERTMIFFSTLIYIKAELLAKFQNVGGNRISSMFLFL